MDQLLRSWVQVWCIVDSNTICSAWGERKEEEAHITKTNMVSCSIKQPMGTWVQIIMHTGEVRAHDQYYRNPTCCCLIKAFKTSVHLTDVRLNTSSFLSPHALQRLQIHLVDVAGVVCLTVTTNPLLVHMARPLSTHSPLSLIIAYSVYQCISTYTTAANYTVLFVWCDDWYCMGSTISIDSSVAYLTRIYPVVQSELHLIVICVCIQRESPIS